MVVESDRAGSQVTCPNCRRTLKVPSGQDRGVQLPEVPAAAKMRTSRICPRCRKEVPVDVQMCPHCKAILMDGPGASASSGGSAPAASRTSSKGAARQNESALKYGGNRGSWWAQLSDGGKFGVIGGIAGGVILVAVILLLVWNRGSVLGGLGAHTDGLKALEEGRRLESLGQFQDAYLMYSLTSRDKALRSTGDPQDAKMADQIKDRYNAMTFLAYDPQKRASESVIWRPKNATELEQGRAAMRAAYGTYRSLSVAVDNIGIPAVAAARANGNKAEYEGKVLQAMDAYVALVKGANPQQLATITFQQLREGVKYMASTLANWDNAERRADYLTRTTKYLEANKEFVSVDPPTDDFWEGTKYSN
jgi:hypothetical protein